ncbi:unnamed protein product [Polarella glacialis]|uniref:Uncharacterized protein n=1 Tax=Polarella glacialis TaxID=89957 RepID=A0A813HVK4_POLGL|nr:unnamed protein product [Polarella glacialis]
MSGVGTRGSDRPLDLGSFRPGGATLLLQMTEDSELVRRRGRCLSHRVMEIYLQEVSAVVFFPRLPLLVRQKIILLMQALPDLVIACLQFVQDGVAAKRWYGIFTTNNNKDNNNTDNKKHNRT